MRTGDGTCGIHCFRPSAREKVCPAEAESLRAAETKLKRKLTWSRVATEGLGLLLWSAGRLLFPGDVWAVAMATRFLKEIPRFCVMKPKSHPRPANPGA